MSDHSNESVPFDKSTNKTVTYDVDIEVLEGPF
jgi:hypothetical protein